MAGRIIEIAIFTLIIVATIAVAVIVPLNSYNQYKDYLAQLEELNKPEIKAELESLTVQLKEGVRYFANDLAEPKLEDFVVTANYVKGEEKYSEPVEEGKFSIRTASDFYSVGGEVTVTYKNVTGTINITLEPLKLESLNVLVNPYTIKYAAGSTFDDAGMVINAIYNDGSSKVLSADDYIVDMQTALTTGDKKVTVSYADGELMKTVDVEIGVSETLDNGAVESIVIVNNAIVNAGETITSASMEVNAVYESGNRKPLAADEYTISGTTDTVQFGRAYELTVAYNADTSKTAKTNVIVRQTIQGEKGTIVGGTTKTEPEYKVIDGVITKLSNSVTFAGGFDDTINSAKEAYVSFNIMSASVTTGNITMRCSNSYCVDAEGGGYMMKPLQINTILDLTVNGREVRVPATVILKGCGPYSSYAPLYGIYYEFTFEDVQLDAGANEIKFNFKKSTEGAANRWGKSPSTLNIDYVHFDTEGNEIPENYTINAIEIIESEKLEYGTKYDEIKLPILATIDGGVKVEISPDLVDFEVVAGGEAGSDMLLFGTYTIKATLKSNPTIAVTKEITIEEFEMIAVKNAYVELVDGKVYYVFTGESIGYTAEDFELFGDDGEIYKSVVEITPTSFILKVDATELPIGTVYPHLRLDGLNYANGTNANGDIRDNGLTFTDGQSVLLNGRSYTIKKEYSMPTLVIAKDLSIPGAINYTFVAGSATDPFIAANGGSTTSTLKTPDVDTNGPLYGNASNKTFTYTINLNVSEATDVMLYIRCAKRYGPYTHSELFGTLTVNGSTDGVVYTDETIEWGTTSSAWGEYKDYALAKLSLKEGNNTVVFTVITSCNIRAVIFNSAVPVTLGTKE